MFDGLLPILVVLIALSGCLVAVSGCLLTMRSYRRAQRAIICDMAAREGVLACYAVIRDGRRYPPYRDPEEAGLDRAVTIRLRRQY